MGIKWWKKSQMESGKFGLLPKRLRPHFCFFFKDTEGKS